MHKKFEINRTKIKGGCQLGRKVVTQNSKSDLPLELSLASSCVGDHLRKLIAVICNIILDQEVTYLPGPFLTD